MHPFSNELTTIISALHEASEKIKTIDHPEIFPLKTKMLNDLRRQADALKLQLGIEPEGGQPVIISPTPLKRIMGKDVTVNNLPADVNKPNTRTSKDVEVIELQLKAEELVLRFLSTSADHLLDSVTDIEIRAVAKHLGLPVTETSPARITTAYIETIKDAIRQKNAVTGNSLPTNILSSGDTLAATTAANIGRETIITNSKSKPLTADEEKELREINTLYEDFNNIDQTQLLENHNHIHIRAVAKLAGLPVSLNSPKVIDGKFIGQIKNAIKRKAELKAMGK